MICYRDMTFCDHWRDCAKRHNCHRPLTDEVREAAEAFGLLVATFMEQPECHEREDPQQKGE